MNLSSTLIGERERHRTAQLIDSNSVSGSEIQKLWVFRKYAKVWMIQTWSGQRLTKFSRGHQIVDGE